MVTPDELIDWMEDREARKAELKARRQRCRPFRPKGVQARAFGRSLPPVKVARHHERSLETRGRRRPSLNCVGRPTRRIGRDPGSSGEMATDKQKQAARKKCQEGPVGGGEEAQPRQSAKGNPQIDGTRGGQGGSEEARCQQGHRIGSRRDDGYRAATGGRWPGRRWPLEDGQGVPDSRREPEAPLEIGRLWIS